MPLKMETPKNGGFRCVRSNGPHTISDGVACVAWGLTFVFIIVFSGSCAAASSCDPIRTFADGKRPLREVFVSSTGNNSAGNGTRNNPYQTINRALQGVQSGDAI